MALQLGRVVREAALGLILILGQAPAQADQFQGIFDLIPDRRANRPADWWHYSAGRLVGKAT